MAMAPKRKATRQPTMERPRTRAQVQREGPPSSQMDTRESSELSTPPREQAESEPDREKMDTGDSPPEEEPSASESGREIRWRSAPEDSGEEPPNRPICCNCRRWVPPNPFLRNIEMDAGQPQTPPDELERYRRIPFTSTGDWETRYSSNPLLWWAEIGRIMFPRLAMMARDYYSTQRKPSVYSGCVDADLAIELQQRRRNGSSPLQETLKTAIKLAWSRRLFRPSSRCVHGGMRAF
jgi:hypothetical protein